MTRPTELTSEHMRDAKLKTQLLKQVDDLNVLEQARQTIIAKMEALVTEKYKGDMKAAANDSEMLSLIRRAHDIESNISSNRAHSAEMIRARARKSVSQKEVSK